MTHISASKLTTTGSDNGLSPDRRQAIIWTKAGMLLIGPLGTNVSEILGAFSNIFIQENEFESVVCEIAAILSRPQCVKPRCVRIAALCGFIRWPCYAKIVMSSIRVGAIKRKNTSDTCQNACQFICVYRYVLRQHAIYDTHTHVALCIHDSHGA